MNMQAPMRHFEPSVDDGRALRDAFGQFATGVAVVTTRTAQGPVGVTVNSFSSVSLDPPLTLWSIERHSNRYDVFSTSENTAIHILSRDQEELCLAFAKDGDAFDLVEWHEGPDGVPLLHGCLARFQCRRFSQHDAGDHTILIDQILDAAMGEGEALTFFRGQFGGIATD